MLKITMKDGSVREVEAGVSVLDFVKQVSNSLAKKVLAAKIDGETKDLTTVLDKDCAVEFLTFEEADGRWALRHTASHILAQAVKRLYKDSNVQLAIGPAIDNGFYYDFDIDRQLTEADLRDIEKEMKKIVKENLKLERKEVSRADAIAFFKEKGENYKVELIEDLPAIGPVRVSVKRAKKPSAVKLAPAGEPLPFKYGKGRVEFTVPAFACHQMVELDD